jgi:hypothetical protein
MQRYKKYLLFMLAGCLSLHLCIAQQQKESKSFQFHSINQIGMLNGQTGSSFQLQTINGLQHKSWFAGIGAGLDYYRFRGIPLFADIRKTFGHLKNKLLVYGDAGIHFSWATDKEKIVNGVTTRLSNGLYLDGGIGYQIGINKRNAALISLGYSYKQVTDRSSIYYFFPMGYYPVVLGGNNNNTLPQTNRLNYHLNRISIKIGWVF